MIPKALSNQASQPQMFFATSLIVILFLAINIFIVFVLSGCCMLLNHINMVCLDSHLLMSRLLLLGLALSGSLVLLSIAILALS